MTIFFKLLFIHSFLLFDENDVKSKLFDLPVRIWEWVECLHKARCKWWQFCRSDLCSICCSNLAIGAQYIWGKNNNFAKDVKNSLCQSPITTLAFFDSMIYTLEMLVFNIKGFWLIHFFPEKHSFSWCCYCFGCLVRILCLTM